MSRAPSPAGSTPAPSTAPRTRARVGGHGELDAVLARVAGAGDDARRRRAMRRRATRNRPTAAASGATRRQALAGLGPLHGDDRPRRGDVRRRRSRRRRRVGVRRVRHDVEALVVDPPHDDVVEHRGVVSSSRCVYWARPGAILPRSLVSAAAARSSASPTLDPHGAEVADVERDGCGAAGPVLGERAGRVRRAACPSRRRRRAWRRARGARRRAASGATLGHDAFRTSAGRGSCQVGEANRVDEVAA